MNKKKRCIYILKFSKTKDLFERLEKPCWETFCYLQQTAKLASRIPTIQSTIDIDVETGGSKIN